jgi:midasin (ATPase involved in ribosome maturation)
MHQLPTVTLWLQVLERVMGLLESAAGSLTLVERGDSASIARHANFRLICAMNPATDAGKRHLPRQARAHFTELYVSEPDSNVDLVRPLCLACAACSDFQGQAT